MNHIEIKFVPHRRRRGGERDWGWRPGGSESVVVFNLLPTVQPTSVTGVNLLPTVHPTGEHNHPHPDRYTHSSSNSGGGECEWTNEKASKNDGVCMCVQQTNLLIINSEFVGTPKALTAAETTERITSTGINPLVFTPF